MVAKASPTNLRGLGTIKLAFVIPIKLVATKPGKTAYRTALTNGTLLCEQYLYNHSFTGIFILKGCSEVVNENLKMIKLLGINAASCDLLPW